MDEMITPHSLGRNCNSFLLGHLRDDLSAAYLQRSSEKCDYIFGITYLELTRWYTSPIMDKSSDKAVLEHSNLLNADYILLKKKNNYLSTGVASARI